MFHRTVLPLLLTLPWTPAALPAQAPQLFAETEVGIFAGVCCSGFLTQVQNAAAGSRVTTQSWRLRPSTSSVYAQLVASLVVSPGCYASQPSASVNIDGTFVGSGIPSATRWFGTTTTSSATVAPVRFMLKVWGAPFSTSTLKLSMSSRASAFATGSFALDVGMDGTIEQTYVADGTPRSVDVPLLFGSQDFMWIRGEYLASGSATTTPTTESFRMYINMRVREDTQPYLTNRRFGVGCGPYLRGRTSTPVGRSYYLISMDVSQAPTYATAAWVVGVQQVSLPLGSCNLLTLPLLVIPTRTSRLGTASYAFAVGTCQLLDIAIQGVFIDNQTRQLVTSNGLQIAQYPPP